MLRSLNDKVKRSRSLITYIALTYTDKVLAFVLPLSILFLLQDKGMYAYVEVAFSYAVLIMTVIELGMSNYLFYGYRNAEDKEKFLRNAVSCFRAILCLYFTVFVAGSLVIGQLSGKNLVLFMIVCLRCLFTLHVGFHTNVWRLREKPARIYLTTISVNLLSIATLALAAFYFPEKALMVFFLPVAVFLGFGCVVFLVRESARIDWKILKDFLGSALTYSWPIIINVLAMTFINNYAKIYAFNRMSEEETAQISFVMRICLIIQLTHAAFASYYSKALYMDERKRLNLRIFLRYAALIAFTAVIAVCIVVVSNRFLVVMRGVHFDMSTAMLILYTVSWCFIGFLELYFGVLNLNRNVLVYSLISATVYVVLLAVSENVTLLRLSIYMVVAAGINLTLVVTGLRRLKVISFSHK